MFSPPFITSTLQKSLKKLREKVREFRDVFSRRDKAVVLKTAEKGQTINVVVMENMVSEATSLVVEEDPSVERQNATHEMGMLFRQSWKGQVSRIFRSRAPYRENEN